MTVPQRLTTLLLLCVCLGSVAAESEFQPRLEFGTGILAGGGFEFVFSPADERYYNDPISRLQWPMAPSAVLQTEVEFPWADWTSTKVELRAAWPLATATLIDEDWRASTSSGFLVYGRSEHTLYLVSYLTARIEESFRWEESFLSLGVTYRETSWNGWNGSGRYQYSASASNPTYFGLVLAYRQQWLIPYLGAGWSWILDNWTLQPSVRIGPYSWCFDVDNHNYAGAPTKTFLDYPRGGIYGQASLEALFPGGARWSWGFRLEGEIHWGTVGDTVVTQSTTGTASFPSSANSAGAGFQEASLSAFVRN